MTISSIPQGDPSPSRVVASEIRAEAARQGISHRELARRIGQQQQWLSRRIGVTAEVDLTLEEIAEMAKALRISPQRLYSFLLPRLDSNQEPSVYQHSQVAAVIELATWRDSRRSA